MYRYSVDSTITYTSEDLVLFKESPFAAWMERLTLENPGHGLVPDAGSTPPDNSMLRQDDVAAMLRSEGRKVVLVDWEESEPVRRSATLSAMRDGADFIVNGQLAVGPLAGSSNLLLKTSGYSELGDYLYVPCDTQGKTNLHSAFRLCFTADLLHSLQGVLPPRMLIIRGGADLLPLQTEDHVYHYRAVKQRFMEAQRKFRKHRMPDPSLSAHFGRWSDCANEVLKQRALQPEKAAEPVQEELDVAVPERAVQQESPPLQVLERRRRQPPPPVYGDPEPAVARDPRPRDSHPLDPAGFSFGKRAAVTAPLPAPAPAAPVQTPLHVSGSAVDRDDDSADRFTPVPFSASLNTRDSLDD
ncbi:hypothetical protein Q6D67_14095 [Haliea sp. E1-2-M8]|uniref:hypothetical protein n=1 Tax=Haliea sp. E1-2-M8 TaxID=3064706 RepID=UPI00271E7934|nr:hypothetical protein [Haliea sp. E1-2-M8]MDO8862838.1 hypothetical protein [Haliea sp. E1-2-M8]